MAPGQNRRGAAAAVVHRRHGRVSVARPGRPEHGDVAARRGARKEKLPSIKDLDNPEVLSRIAGARRSGPTSAADGAIRSIREMLDDRRREAAIRDVAIERVLGVNDKELSDRLARRDSQAYGR